MFSPLTINSRCAASLACLLFAAGSSSAIAQTEQHAAGLWDREHLTGNWRGLRTAFEARGITFELEQKSETWGSGFGGIKTGEIYNGLTTASLTLDLNKLVGWQGAKLFVNAFEIQGHGPSTTLAGNLQLISNIEATPDLKLYDLWIEQELFEKRLSIRLGQEGANDEMMLTKYGAVLLNSSFGFPGLPAADLPSGGPNYPMAAPFVRVRYTDNKFSFTGAVFTDDPAPPGIGDPQARDAGGTTFRLNDHSLSFAELAYEGEVAGLPGTYKLGAWWSSEKLLQDQFATVGNEVLTGGTGAVAIYGIVDQLLWRELGTKDDGIGAFLQVMGTPTEICFSNLFVEGGLNWKGLVPGRHEDTFALGVAYLGVSPTYENFANTALRNSGAIASVKNNETVLEATYLYEVARWWQLQPDVQYVINPSAGLPNAISQRPIGNALVAGVRATVEF